MTQLLRSIDPASEAVVWDGSAATPAECGTAVERARAAFPGWAATPLEERIALARRYADALKADAVGLSEILSRETGKLLWETRAEVAAMVGKVEISITAQAERAGSREQTMPFGRAVLRHRPHGVMLVLGPYNFPGHLPNGHIVPALLAGNTVVFKPSEEAPATAERMMQAWRTAGLPEDVLQVLQGGRETGAALVEADIDGLLFTGSAGAGAHFRRLFADRPHVILALELGGNNPMLAWDGDEQAIASLVAHSAFVTTGQRCSCARRLIVPVGADGDRFVEAVVDLAARLPVAAWDEAGDAFMGPLISARAADAAHDAVEGLIGNGARVLLPSRPLEERSRAFMAPVVLETTGLAMPDSEIFAPVLQVRRMPDFDAAIAEANATNYGLSAGLVSADAQLWERFAAGSRAGVVNWNRPTTGAASSMPFGGLGDSGNHRPSAYYAADYCAWPAASFEAGIVETQALPGL
ncbi:succinylglutamate-semialdehyde dehydrogenase [Sphingomonas hengshuiensis]|uniref:Succinylglutamate-semialdehyde dehydrogenase n=1 Tax=Sphingomonas hengshuiensis TaxID=1609977 RepID=A0A7U4JAW9_9SPHN|nr:succinylglutamate-semialdehyde dehydrogenase [Sphingomonas hengshuiensis]AJP73455.1 succinylglutamate-semialdehyde dehydrogenase [Sphingomonas hengshuiensis]